MVAFLHANAAHVLRRNAQRKAITPFCDLQIHSLTPIDIRWRIYIIAPNRARGGARSPSSLPYMPTHLRPRIAMQAEQIRDPEQSHRPHDQERDTEIRRDDSLRIVTMHPLR